MQTFYKRKDITYKINTDIHCVNVFIHYDIYKGKTFPKLFHIARYEKMGEKIYTGSFVYNETTFIHELIKEVYRTIHSIETELETDYNMLPLRRKD